MPRRRGGDANIPGLHRDPMDFRGVEKELSRQGRKVSPVPLSIQRPPLDVETLAGFAWQYLKKHYDRPTATEIAPGMMGWSPFHVDMWEYACAPNELVALAAPRAHAKSTSITLAYGLANLLFRCEDYIVVVSDTFEAQAVEHIREYRRELIENEELIRDFGVNKLVKDVEGDMIIRFNDGCLARIKALGMEGSIRGLKWRSKRPGMFLIDDAENPELVESKLRRDKSRNWLMKDLLPAGRRDRKVRMVGTILHDDAALARFCRSASWHSKIYRAHKSFDDFSNVLWPEMWPEEKLRKERQRFIEQNDSDGYSQEYLNEPVSPVDAYFKPDDLIAIEEKDLTSHGEYYVGWDFAVSKEQRSDYSVGTIWKVDELGHKQIIDCVRGRWDGLEIIDMMIQVEQTYRPQVHFTEKGTIDHALGPFLDTELMRRGENINLVKITRNKDKPTFAKPLQGMIRRHDVSFNKKMAQWPSMEEELRRFLKAGHDDIVDALSIVAQGLREITLAPTEQEREDEDYFGRLLDQNATAFHGQNETTGY